MTVIAATRPSGIYFGWRVVLALSMCAAMLMGIGLSGFIMLSEHMAREFGWSSTDTGNLVSAMWLTAPVALLSGPLVRKVGPWRLVYAGMSLQALSVAGIQATGSYELMLGLRLLSGLGLIMIVAASPVIVAHWFKARFATAMSIVWSAGSAGQIVLPPLTVALNAMLGWRHTALVLAALVGLTVLVARMLAHGATSPSELGLAQDGYHAGSGPDDGTTEGADLPWGMALRSMNWLTAAFMCVGVFGAGAATLALQAHSPAMLGAFGFSEASSATLLSTFYATALAGTIIGGWLLDRVSASVVSLIVSAMVFGSPAILLLTGADTTYADASLALGLIGLALGAGEVLWITLFKRQFGAPAFATSYGIFFFFMQMGMASGGLLGGLSYESGGSKALLVTIAALYLAPALFSLWRPAMRNSEA